MSNSRSSRSKLLIGAAVLAILAGGVLVASQYYPAKPGTTAGTVAPMTRYNANQVSDKDVVTGDTTVPTMLQTDSFQPVNKQVQVAAKASAQAASSAAAMASNLAAAQNASMAASQAAN